LDYAPREVSSFAEETCEKCSFLLKFKKGENFNHMNTLSIFRGLKFEPDAEIGQKGGFSKVSNELLKTANALVPNCV